MKYKLYFARLLALFIVATNFAIQVKAADNPHAIEGHIKNNIYNAKNNLFSIAIPHKEGSYEFAYMQIKEEFHGDQGAYVSFGPAAFNQSIYRIGLYRIDNEKNLDTITARLVKNFSLQLEQAYQTKLTLETPYEKKTINGKGARYGTLTQKIPSGIRFNQGKMEAIESIYRHIIYVIDFGNFKALVWVQTPSEQQLDNSMKIAASISPGITPRAFAESLVIH